MTSPMPLAGLGDYAEQVIAQNRMRQERAMQIAQQEQAALQAAQRSQGQQQDLLSPSSAMDFNQLLAGSTTAGLGATTPQMTSAGGGLASSSQGIGVASVPGGVGNAAVPPPATGMGGQMYPGWMFWT